MKRIFAIVSICLTIQCLPSLAWWPQGHSILAAAALKSLPDDMPAYFRNDPGLVAHCAQDPDVSKSAVTPLVTDREDPEHYIDYELLKGQPFPATRDAYMGMIAKLNLSPKQAGTLPYTVAEWTEHLAITFAEYRKWPDDPYIQTKSLVYAGILAHYAGDMTMPLHVTNDYDGRANADGSSPHTGIHAKVDSLIEKVNLKPTDLAKGQTIEPVNASVPVPADWQAPANDRAVIKGLVPTILQEMDKSRALIDRTYALENQLPPQQGDWHPSADITAFTTERARAGTRFIASLYLTAWRRSAAIQMPKWLVRETTPVVQK